MDNTKNNNFVQTTEILNIFKDIIDKNNGDFSSIVNHNLTLKDKLYCKGMSAFRLGYFNPCPVEDLVIGNTNRGKIISNKALSDKPASKNTIIYYFEKNVLKMAEDSFTYYLFFYTETQCVYILEIGKNLQPHCYSTFLICKYDEYGRICKITKFCTVLIKNQALLFSFMKPNLQLISDKNQNEYLFYVTEKEYFYSENFIAKFQLITYSSDNIDRQVSQYDFNYCGDSYSSYIYNGKEYKVLRKRKFNEFVKKPNFSDYQK